MWNSFQIIPIPYSSGAPSLRPLSGEAAAGSLSKLPSIGTPRMSFVAGRGFSVCVRHRRKIAFIRRIGGRPWWRRSMSLSLVLTLSTALSVEGKKR